MALPPNLDRRDFLKGSTGVLTGVLIAGSPLALIATGPAWALDLNVLSSAEATRLMAVTRTIAPHDQLEDAAYALVVKGIDESCRSDAQQRERIVKGLAGLSAGFATAPETTRVAELRQIESGEFFQNVRTQTLGSLYASPIAYAYFGYEGESFSKGGYLRRGFNDLRWLPEVPLQDSGPF